MVQSRRRPRGCRGAMHFRCPLFSRPRRGPKPCYCGKMVQTRRGPRGCRCAVQFRGYYEHGLGMPKNLQEATALYTQAALQSQPKAIAWFTSRGLPIPTTSCTTLVPASEFLSLTCDECGRRCKPNYCAKCLITNYCSRECKLSKT